MTKLRSDWHTKMHMYLGYLPTEDEESLRAFNKCIKDIIASERCKWERKYFMQPLNKKERKLLNWAMRQKRVGGEQ